MFKRNNKATFLFEIGTEELPPKSLRQLASSLHDNICSGIREQGLSFVNSQLFAGPRRIAILLKGLDTCQAEQQIEKRGPSINAAYDKDGKPTKAAEGFAASCGISLDQAEVLETKKGAWLVYRNTEAGKSATELMPEILSEAVKKMHIGKAMHWGNHDFEFVRPVHWLIAMLDNETLPLELFGISASNETRGHHFMQPGMFKIKSPEKYLTQLEKQGKVIADFNTRRDRIKQQIHALEEQHSAHAIIDQNLLDEVANLVEWPAALAVDFDAEFLTVPQAALIAAMQNHQKCFALTDQSGALLPKFITICNIDSKDPQQVIRGNQKVMRARLADAKFFYETDLKTPLAEQVKKLADITFEEQLGSLAQRVERICQLSQYIAQHTGADSAAVQRAATLAKADLVTELVGEFPELQGTIGYYYAKHDGEANDVALAIRDHYKPKSAVDTVAKQPLAVTVAIADKIDLLVGIFGIDKKPTGDKDPFALRRAALGVIRTILENDLQIDLSELIQQSINSYQNNLPNKNVAQDVLHFIYERLRAWYKDQGITNPIFNAVLATEPTCLDDFNKRIHAVVSFKRMPEARSLSEANKRVTNILNKNAEHIPTGDVKDQLLQEAAEKQLAKAITAVNQTIADSYQQQKYAETLRQLAQLKQPVDDFFEHVMVMTDDQALKQNRLLLLKQLRQLLSQVADISLLQ